MRRQYDDFTQLKLKDMSKAMSDMTHRYINPQTQEPTKVPSAHYEKILNQVTEKYMADITSRQFLIIMYNQLVNFKKEDEKYFNQALLCIDLGLNPKDLRLDEQIAIEYTNNFINDKKNYEKKDYHFMNEDIIDKFKEIKSNPKMQADAIRMADVYDEIENNKFDNYNRDER